MVEEHRYFRIKRQVFSQLQLGELSKDGYYLLSVWLNGAHFDTGERITSYKEVADLLGCSRKKATAEVKKLKELGYILYETSKGKKKFVIKLLHYYPADPNKPSKKEQVNSGVEQVKAQVQSLSNQGSVIPERDRLENMLKRSNIIESNRIECNGIEDNNSGLFFHNIRIPEGTIKKYGHSAVSLIIDELTQEYPNNPPLSPFSLIESRLQKHSDGWG